MTIPLSPLVNPVEFIGYIGTNQGSEIRAAARDLDPELTVRWARAQEDGGFDRVLVAHNSAGPDGFVPASWALHHTTRLTVLLAQRPGFVAPTLHARQLATLDQFSGGRLALHVITGGNDDEQRRDGDHLNKADRYRRTDEYLTILKRELTSPEPFDYDGEFYKVVGSPAALRTVTQPHLPIYFGGSSDEAIAVAAKHADVYALWGEPLADVAGQIKRVKDAAAEHGRNPGISVSFRPILGRTDDEAWERAYRILAEVKENGPDHTRHVVLGQGPDAQSQPTNVGSQRLLDAAARGDRHDRALFTALASASGARGNSTALVGSPETVAQALIDYHDIGVTTFLIRGYHPYEDAVDYGRLLIPLVRQELAHRNELVPA